MHYTHTNNSLPTYLSNIRPIVSRVRHPRKHCLEVSISKTNISHFHDSTASYHVYTNNDLTTFPFHDTHDHIYVIGMLACEPCCQQQAQETAPAAAAVAAAEE